MYIVIDNHYHYCLIEEADKINSLIIKIYFVTLNRGIEVSYLHHIASPYSFTTNTKQLTQ